MYDVIVAAEDEKLLENILSADIWEKMNIKVKPICTKFSDGLFENTDIVFDKLISLVNERSDSFLYTLDRVLKTVGEDENVLKNIVKKIFDENKWLKKYANENISTKAGLTALFEIICELSPKVNNEKIADVIDNIINFPENDLRQTAVAEKLHKNSSYLSTVFTAHTNRRFVDFVNDVRLRRAAYLLSDASLKVADIAERLEYRDMAYFSKLFKRKFGMTPSLYRIPDQYNYQI